MRRITFIEFEKGDTLPDWVTVVFDREGDVWTRQDDGAFRSTLPSLGTRTEKGMLSMFGPVRADITGTEME